MSNLHKNKNFILIVCGILLTAGVLFFLTRTEYENILTLKQNYQDKNTTLQTDQSKLSTLQKLSDHPDEAKQIEEFSESQLPDDIDSSTFVSSIEKLGNTLQITPLSVSVSSTPVSSKDKNSAPGYNFSITFNSSFQGLITFLAEMEKLDRFNSINDLSLSPGDKGLSVNLSGDIYQFRNSK
jgi:Tfp pilus assembly protein PilO